MKKIVYKYYPFITVYRDSVRNKFLKRKNFHKIKLQDSAMVILTNKKKEILFLNEYRHGILRKSLGFPGGHIEKNEKPLNSIKRELLEETGYVAKEWKLLFSYTRHGTYNCGNDYVFTAKVNYKKIDKKKEKIDSYWYNLNKIHKLINLKKFKTVGIIAAILYYVYKKN